MRPAWQRSSGQEDMEALQTDVMRFMAILGLCLAAIFSLVKSPDYLPPGAPKAAQTTARNDAPVAPRPRQPAPKKVATPESPPATPTALERSVARVAEVTPASPAAPPPALDAPSPDPGATPEAPTLPSATQTTASTTVKSEARGFELVFASAEDLHQLLTQGGTALYATDGERFWRWQPGGQWTNVAPPTSYYRMDAETVPRAFRRGIPPALAGAGTTWGIDLSARTVQGISEQMRRHTGGLLVIDGRGDVSLGEGSARR